MSMSCGVYRDRCKVFGSNVHRSSTTDDKYVVSLSPSLSLVFSLSLSRFLYRQSQDNQE